MRWRYLSIGLFGLAFSFAAAFGVSLFEPRTPTWGYAVFGVPAVLTGSAFAWAARRYIRS